MTNNNLHSTWLRFSAVPFGKRMFSYFVGLYIPYTGSMAARIEEMHPGYAKVILNDRRRVRNHLKCVHAIALANLVELCGNLSVVCGLPEDARFIVKSITVEYLKKARGKLTAECTSLVIMDNAEREIPVRVEIKNSKGELVTVGNVYTLVGPK